MIARPRRDLALGGKTYVINAGVLSKNIAAASELTLMAKIRPGFVNLPDPMSYATRLQKLLGNLFSVRKVETEEGSSYIGPVDRLRTIHFFRFAVFDGGTRLLLAVSFDRPWEPYINRLVDDAGPLLDAIFSHCEDYEGHATRDGYLKFAEWVRSKQRECDFFFAAFPSKSIEDILYLKQLQKNAEALVSKPSPGKSAATLPLDSQLSTLENPPLGLPEYMNLYRTTVGLYRLRNYFPDNPVIDSAYSDRAVFDRGAGSVIHSFGEKEEERFPPLPAAIAETYLGIEDWYMGLKQEPKVKPAPAGRPPADVQTGILEQHQDPAPPGGNPKIMSHGAAVLLQFPTEDPSESAASQVTPLFGYLIRMCQATSGTRYNIGITAEGLKKLGLSEQSLLAFPVEFLQGMAERAALLGDVGSNYSDRWRLPKRNYDRPTEHDVPLSTVDAVVLVQACKEYVEGDHEWSKDHPLFDDVKILASNGCTVLHVQPLRREASRLDQATGLYREHFGFLEGITQPVIKEAAQLGKEGRNEIAHGEVLLGHPNDAGETFGLENPLLVNGSFLVLRKLSQDVEAFNEQAGGNATTALATKFAGRSSEGRPATDPQLSVNDDFDYGNDVDGVGCPLQSHVRLANPRTPEGVSSFGRRKRVPRLVRRGFSYGLPFTGDGDAKAERGLLFMAYNASIAQQYEVIQRWLNGANSTGLDGAQRCPLTGAIDREGGTAFHFRDRGTVTTVKLKKQMTTLEWGMYLFVPSVAALGMLRDRLLEKLANERARAEGKLTPTLDELNVVAKGQQILAQLQQQTSPDAWRGVLEEQGSRKQSIAVLNAIRVNHRVLRTPLGVLVAGGKETLHVLTREDLFSTRDYWRRMNESQMLMHLGMDMRPLPETVCPARPGKDQDKPADAGYVAAVAKGEAQYFLESIANAQINQITRAQAFRATSLVMSQALGVAVQKGQSILKAVEARSGGQRDPSASPRAPLDLYILTEQVVSQLSKLWFGLPDGKFIRFGGQPTTPKDPPGAIAADDATSYCPSDFTVFSQYVFRPEPDEWTASLSAKRGMRVTESARKALAEMRLATGEYKHPFVQGLAKHGALLGLSGGPLNELVVRSTVGAVDGFVAAAFGSFLSVIAQWLETEDFWRIQRIEGSTPLVKLGNEAEFDPGTTEGLLLDSAPLVRRAARALFNLPKPAWLHRIALRDTLLGNLPIKKGERVSVHLGQAAVELGPELLFGGHYDEAKKNLVGADRTPTHACPGREVSMGVLLGMLVGLLNLKNVQLDGTLAITFEPNRA